MEQKGLWSDIYKHFEEKDAKFTGFMKVLVNKSFPPFLNVVKTILFIPPENADLSKDPHLVISIESDNENPLAAGNFFLLFVNPDDGSLVIDKSESRFLDVTDKVDQMELIISFLTRHQDYIMVSRALVPFDLVLVNKVGGEVNVGPTSIKLIWDSLGVGFQSFKFAVRHNFLGPPSATSSNN